jgi:maltose O-acetyltransferase
VTEAAESLTERDRMLAGALYDPGDAELVALRRRAQRLMRDYNATVHGDDAERAALLGDLLGTWNGAVIRPPFHVDYGAHIHFGPGCFVNYGCVTLDVCAIRVGAGTQIGPYVQILAADHPRGAEVRAKGLENGRPVTVGANVWIGGGAILLPGVTVGDDAIIGAGAVVTRDVAPGMTVAGNPARPLGH